MTLSHALIGAAGVHYVVSELSRRGFVALPTVRNVAAYDVIAATIDGKHHWNIQVKTSLKRVSFFPMPPSDQVRCGRDDIYVFVRWWNAERRFEAFMLSGMQARAEVRRRELAQDKRIAGGTRKVRFPCVRVGPSTGTNAEIWRKQWEFWDAKNQLLTRAQQRRALME